MPNYINELALLFTVATVLSVAARFFKQPLILAYLATGGLIAYFGFVDVVGRDTFQLFADLGIMFLLFLVGLEINYTSLRLVGKASLIIGTGQILFTSSVGFLIAKFLGFEVIPALYIGLGLAFSSTIIIIKLLTDKRDLNSLYGKISIGLLLVQDIVAVLILVVLSGIEQSGSFSWIEVGVTLLKAIALFATIIWLGRKILPHLFDEIAHSQELLFLTSTAWVFMIAAIVSKIGFSIEIAGFVAGLGLANSSENFQIANRIRPLRDFFILIFFIILGTSFIFTDFGGITIPVIILSAFVIVGNPLILLILMGLLGFKKRTSFLTGLTVAQISEFSLIMAALGAKIGHIDQRVVGLITAVGIVTITLSSYLILHGNRIFRVFESILWIFEKRKLNDSRMPKDIKKPIVLIGFNRTGQSLARNLPMRDLMVIDFDPDITKKLDYLGYDYIFGDISDTEIYEQAITYMTRLVISTSPDLEDNLLLVNMLKHRRKRPGIVVRAETEKDAVLLYQQGADYVLLPHLASGHHFGKLLAKQSSTRGLRQLREKDLKMLKQEFHLS